MFLFYVADVHQNIQRTYCVVVRSAYLAVSNGK